MFLNCFGFPIWMFEEQLGSERRFLDAWLENNFPERDSEGAPLWSFPQSAHGNEWRHRETGHLSLQTPQNAWRNTTKSFQVLTFLCSELQLLEKWAQKKFYPALYVIGGSLVRGHSPPMGDLELQLANLLPTLQDVQDYSEHLSDLLQNVFGQISAILLDDSLDIKPKVVSTAFKCASRGLVVLFCLQTLLSIKILPLFFNYRRMLHTMMSKAQNEAELEVYERVQEQVVHLEESLRIGAFTNFLDNRIKHGPIRNQFQRRSISVIIESYLLQQIDECCSQLDSQNEGVLARSDLLATLLLSVAYCWAGSFPKDRRVLKAVVEIHQKAPLLPMYYTLVVVPARFLLDMLPSSFLSSLPWDYIKQSSNQSTTFLQNLQKSIVVRLDRMAYRGSIWASELTSMLSEEEGIISAADRDQFLSLMLEGLHMMTHLRRTMDNMIQLHVEQLQPMSKDTLRCVTSCICYLKLLSGHIARTWELVEQNMDFFLEHFKALLLDAFKRAYDHLVQLEKNDRTLRVRRALSRLGTHSPHSPEYLTVCVKLVKMGIQALQEKASTPQRTLMTLIVHSISGFQFVPDFFEEECLSSLKQMEIVEQIGEHLQGMGRCDLLYFHPELIRNAFQQLLQHPDESNKLPHLVNSFLDIRFLAEEAEISELSPMFEQYIGSMLKVYFLAPLSRMVERDLIGMVDEEFSQQNHQDDDVLGQKNVLPLLQLEPLSLITRDLCILDAVTVRVSKSLRSLSIRGALRWEVLCKVKNIAQEKYGMVLEIPEATDGATPSTLDHLDSADGVKAFVASYMFQLHSFTFVLSPRTPSNPHNDLPEVVGIEDFMDLIQSDIIQVGPAALISLASEKDRGRSSSRIGIEEKENDGGAMLSAGSKSEDGDGRQDQASDDLASAMSNIMASYDSFKKSSSIPQLPGSVLNPGRGPWSFLEKSRELYYQESLGSVTSLQPAPRSVDHQTKEGRVTNLMHLLTNTLKEKLKHVTELCGASETRSVLSQTTQRWHNSQKAVGNRYPVPQAELVRKEVIALLKAGTLTTNIIHKLRFLIGDVGKVVSMVMLLFHGASCVREKTFSILPRDVVSGFVSLSDFLRQISDHEKLVQEASPFDHTFHGFAPRPSINVQYLQFLEPIFEGALDESHLEVLRNLFILAPAMSLDHIESMRSLKNQYQGSSLNKIVASTDDSFAMGLSFLLSLLNQMAKFESFHWFESASREYHVRLDRVQATAHSQRTNTGSSSRRMQDVETQRTNDIMDSLRGNVNELKLLERSMQCAKVFFQRRNCAKKSMTE